MHPPHLLHEPIVTNANIRNVEARAYPEAVPFHSTGELLADASAEFRDRQALILAETDEIDRPPVTWSFAELWQNVRRAKNILRKLGVARDQPVALPVPIRRQRMSRRGGAVCWMRIFNQLFALSKTYCASPGHHRHLPAGDTGAGCRNKHSSNGTPGSATVGLYRACSRHRLRREDLFPTVSRPRVAQQRPDLEYAPGLRRDKLAAPYHTGGTTGSPKILRYEHGDEFHMSWFATHYYDMAAEDVIRLSRQQSEGQDHPGEKRPP